MKKIKLRDYAPLVAKTSREIEFLEEKTDEKIFQICIKNNVSENHIRKVLGLRKREEAKK